MATLNLTTSIAQPSINRIEIISYHTDAGDALAVPPRAASMRVVVRVYNGASQRALNNPRTVEICNGTCVGVRATASPTGFEDAVQHFRVTVAERPALATALDDATAAMVGNRNARENALLAYLAGASVGLLPAGT